MKSKIKRFETINGLRALACLLIILMHVKTNLNYYPNVSWFNTFIRSFTNCVFLFMMVSAFSMCCGYYDKIKNNSISPKEFYSKRIKKILPFFLFLIIINLIIEHSFGALIESFADSTLLFGFLNKQIEIIGVAWFLGLIVIFYIMFPFFTYLFDSKKRAWIVTLIAFLMNYTCVYYFNVGRQNMFFSFIYFCIGGLLYLYKDQIIKIFSSKKILSLTLLTVSLFLFYIIPINNQYMMLPKNILLFSSLMIFAISNKSKVLDNKFTKEIGNISFEIYLCHMVIFRAIEKLNILNAFNNNLIAYIIGSILTILGSIVFSMGFKYIYDILKSKFRFSNNRQKAKKIVK